MRLLIKKLKENAVIPARQTEFSAGYDLCACTDAPVTIKAGQTEKIHTGISAEVQGEKTAFFLSMQEAHSHQSSALPLQTALALLIGTTEVRLSALSTTVQTRTTP